MSNVNLCWSCAKYVLGGAGEFVGNQVYLDQSVQSCLVSSDLLRVRISNRIPRQHQFKA